MTGRLVLIEREIIYRATIELELEDGQTVEELINGVKEYEEDCLEDMTNSVMGWHLNEESVTYREWQDHEL